MTKQSENKPTQNELKPAKDELNEQGLNKVSGGHGILPGSGISRESSIPSVSEIVITKVI